MFCIDNKNLLNILKFIYNNLYLYHQYIEKSDYTDNQS